VLCLLVFAQTIHFIGYISWIATTIYQWMGLDKHQRRWSF